MSEVRQQCLTHPMPTWWTQYFMYNPGSSIEEQKATALLFLKNTLRVQFRGDIFQILGPFRGEDLP